MSSLLAGLPNSIFFQISGPYNGTFSGSRSMERTKDHKDEHERESGAAGQLL